MNNTVTPEKLNKYFSVTEEALAKAKHAFDQKRKEQAEDFYMMAYCYFHDAKYFLESRKDAVLAFAALNYAHGWLDAGARIGLFRVRDSSLFTVDDGLRGMPRPATNTTRQY